MTTIRDYIMPLAKIRKGKEGYQVTLPDELCEELDLDEGDVLEAAVRNNELVFTPTLDLSPEERAEIDAAFEQGAKDYEAGRGAGPFESDEELQAYLDTLKAS